MTSFMRHSRPVHSAILLAPIVNHHTSIVYCYQLPILRPRSSTDAMTFLCSFPLYFVYVKAIVSPLSKILRDLYLILYHCLRSDAFCFFASLLLGTDSVFYCLKMPMPQVKVNTITISINIF